MMLNIDPKQVEMQCIKAIKHNNIISFNENFLLLSNNQNTFILSYKLIYLLLINKEDFYFLAETITDFDDPNIKFMYEIEKAVNSGSKKRLCNFRDSNKDYSGIINCLIEKMDKEEKVDVKDVAQKNKNIEMIQDCTYILKNYNKY
ncbi:hypothetical protein BDAP_002271 [Binucleata daphniae]